MTWKQYLASPVLVLGTVNLGLAVLVTWMAPIFGIHALILVGLQCHTVPEWRLNIFRKKS